MPFKRKVILKTIDTTPEGKYAPIRWGSPEQTKAQIDWLRDWANYLERPETEKPDGPNPCCVTELLQAAMKVDHWFETLKVQQYKQMKQCADSGKWDVEIGATELDLQPLKRAIRLGMNLP